MKNSFIVIIDSNGEIFFCLILSNDIVVQKLMNLLWSHKIKILSCLLGELLCIFFIQSDYILQITVCLSNTVTADIPVSALQKKLRLSLLSAANCTSFFRCLRSFSLLFLCHFHFCRDSYFYFYFPLFTSYFLPLLSFPRISSIIP